MDEQQNSPELINPIQEPAPQIKQSFPFIRIMIMLLFIVGIIIIVVIFREGSRVVSKLISKNQPIPTILILPTIETKTQQSILIATDSGYLKIKEEVQILKNTVNSNPIDDTTLMPPTIDTVIDFAK